MHACGRCQTLLYSLVCFFPHSPGNTHDHCHNNGDLHGSNDSSYKHIMKFLATGYHIQDVKVGDLLTLCPRVTRVTPVEMQETHFPRNVIFQ